MNLISNITQKWIVTTVLISVFASSMIVLGGISHADGNHSPDNCIGRLNSGTIVSSITGSEDSAVYDTKNLKIVSGVCIKSGKESFGNLQHSTMITADGTYENCYKVNGIGTAKISVNRTHSSNSCKGISHIDVRISDKVAQTPEDDKNVVINPGVQTPAVLGATTQPAKLLTKPQVIAPVGGVAAGVGSANLSVAGLSLSLALIVAGVKMYRTKFNS